MCGCVEVFVAVFWGGCWGGVSRSLLFSFSVFRFIWGGGGIFLKTKAPFSRPANFFYGGGGDY